MHLKTSSAEVVCLMKMLATRTHFAIQANNVDPIQAAHRVEVRSRFTLFETETF